MTTCYPTVRSGTDGNSGEKRAKEDFFRSGKRLQKPKALCDIFYQLFGAPVPLMLSAFIACGTGAIFLENIYKEEKRRKTSKLIAEILKNVG